MTLLPMVHIIRFSISALLIWVLFYTSIRRLMLDRLRQQLFAIRDRLFNFAADGGIGFSDPIYRELRDDINGLILFAHKVSFGRLLLSRCLIEPDLETVRLIEHWIDRVAQLPNLQRRELMEIRDDALSEVWAYMVRRSPWSFVLLKILQIMGLCANGVRAFVLEMPKKLVAPLEIQARGECRIAS